MATLLVILIILITTKEDGLHVTHAIIALAFHSFELHRHLFSNHLPHLSNLQFTLGLLTLLLLFHKRVFYVVLNTLSKASPVWQLLKKYFNKLYVQWLKENSQNSPGTHYQKEDVVIPAAPVNLSEKIITDWAGLSANQQSDTLKTLISKNRLDARQLKTLKKLVDQLTESR